METYSSDLLVRQHLFSVQAGNPGQLELLHQQNNLNDNVDLINIEILTSRFITPENEDDLCCPGQMEEYIVSYGMFPSGVYGFTVFT